MGIGKAVAIGTVLVVGAAVAVGALALKAIDAWVAFLPPRRR